MFEHRGAEEGGLPAHHGVRIRGRCTAAGGYGIYYYHDSKKLAEFIRGQSWGAVQPVRAIVGAKGRVFYARTHH